MFCLIRNIFVGGFKEWDRIILLIFFSFISRYIFFVYYWVEVLVIVIGCRLFIFFKVSGNYDMIIRNIRNKSIDVYMRENVINKRLV